nr:STAS domain-containing protein [Rubinisphaera margarita]
MSVGVNILATSRAIIRIVADDQERLQGRERRRMANQEDFRLEWHGDIVVVTPASNIESMNWDLIEQAAEVIMAPLQNQDVPVVVVDLSEVGYFGSVFLALLLRCHKYVKSRGGELVLCGASEMATELLRITALDTLWAIYDTREEALDAVT